MKIYITKGVNGTGVSTVGGSKALRSSAYGHKVYTPAQIAATQQQAAVSQYSEAAKSNIENIQKQLQKIQLHTTKKKGNIRLNI